MRFLAKAAIAIALMSGSAAAETLAIVHFELPNGEEPNGVRSATIEAYYSRFGSRQNIDVVESGSGMDVVVDSSHFFGEEQYLLLATIISFSYGKDAPPLLKTNTSTFEVPFEILFRRWRLDNEDEPVEVTFRLSYLPRDGYPFLDDLEELGKSESEDDQWTRFIHSVQYYANLQRYHPDNEFRLPRLRRALANATGALASLNNVDGPIQIRATKKYVDYSEALADSSMKGWRESRLEESMASRFVYWKDISLVTPPFIRQYCSVASNVSYYFGDRILEPSDEYWLDAKDKAVGFIRSSYFSGTDLESLVRQKQSLATCPR